MENNSRPMIFLGDNTALTRTIYNHKMYVDTRDISLAPHILLDGYWEMWITKIFISLIQPGMTVVDIGANIGYYSLIAGSHVGDKGKVISFEANPKVFRLLAKSMEVNGFYSRSELVNKGVMDKAGELTFNSLRDHHGGSGFFVSESGAEQFRDQIEKINVPCLSLDEFFRGRDIRVDVMKIDAEGAENHIIAGAIELLKRNPEIKILMEYTPANQPAVENLLGLGLNAWNIRVDSSLEPVTPEALAAGQTPWEMLLFARS
jgi:FkbM family methyltransferase